jgi:hypothetical protein
MAYTSFAKDIKQIASSEKKEYWPAKVSSRASTTDIYKGVFIRDIHFEIKAKDFSKGMPHRFCGSIFDCTAGWDCVQVKVQDKDGEMVFWNPGSEIWGCTMMDGGDKLSKYDYLEFIFSFAEVKFPKCFESRAREANYVHFWDSGGWKDHFNLKLVAIYATPEWVAYQNFQHEVNQLERIYPKTDKKIGVLNRHDASRIGDSWYVQHVYADFYNDDTINTIMAIALKYGISKHVVVKKSKPYPKKWLKPQSAVTIPQEPNENEELDL